jgi:hypothetical protein
LGDNQYHVGSLSDFNASFDPTWGRLKPIIHPAVGNHEYATAGAHGYFDYFNGPGNPSGPAGERDKGYYSFDIGSWHLIALNSECGRMPRGGRERVRRRVARRAHCDPASPPSALRLPGTAPRSGFRGNHPETRARRGPACEAGRRSPQRRRPRPRPSLHGRAEADPAGIREFVVAQAAPSSG